MARLQHSSKTGQGTSQGRVHNAGLVRATEAKRPDQGIPSHHRPTKGTRHTRTREMSTPRRPGLQGECDFSQKLGQGAFCEKPAGGLCPRCNGARTTSIQHRHPVACCHSRASPLWQVSFCLFVGFLVTALGKFQRKPQTYKSRAEVSTHATSAFSSAAIGCHCACHGERLFPHWDFCIYLHPRHSRVRQKTKVSQ